jgi:hypothetical protein
VLKTKSAGVTRVLQSAQALRRRRGLHGTQKDFTEAVRYLSKAAASTTKRRLTRRCMAAALPEIVAFGGRYCRERGGRAKASPGRLSMGDPDVHREFGASVSGSWASVAFPRAKFSARAGADCLAVRRYNLLSRDCVEAPASPSHGASIDRQAPEAPCLVRQ